MSEEASISIASPISSSSWTSSVIPPSRAKLSKAKLALYILRIMGRYCIQ
uniref:Putative beta-1 3-galactosyltransferase 10 isoform X3 n=1 Tax=Rhizophora mucronata TaxID=61149 RepID=A0A2P2LE19_RHIMU